MARPMNTFSIVQLSPGKGFTPARPVRDNRAKEYRMVRTVTDGMLPHFPVTV